MGWKFSDGETVNADSVIFVLNMAKAEKANWYAFVSRPGRRLQAGAQTRRPGPVANPQSGYPTGRFLDQTDPATLGCVPGTLR